MAILKWKGGRSKPKPGQVGKTLKNQEVPKKPPVNVPEFTIAHTLFCSLFLNGQATVPAATTNQSVISPIFPAGVR